MFDIDSVDLPKWPQMIVRGLPVSKEQADDIIIRTDIFWRHHGSNGNNHDFERAVCAAVGVPRVEYNNPNQDWGQNYQDWDQFYATIDYCSTNYVHNDWISCCFAGGPHGWCHPDGTILFNDNVGKWPVAADILADWQLIARKWPFLDLEVAVMSGESCEDQRECLMVITVKDGVAAALGPDYPVFERFCRDIRSEMTDLTEQWCDYIQQCRDDNSRENTFTVDHIVNRVNSLVSR